MTWCTHSPAWRHGVRRSWPEHMVAPVVLVPECGGHVGFGHLERMLALADALREFVDTVVITVAEDGVVARVGSRGHTAVPLPGEAGDRALTAVSQYAPGLAVLDGYVFSRSTQTAIRESCRLVLVDDLDGPCDCDLAVNPAPGTDESTGPDGASATLRGPSFALLAADYRSARDRRGEAPPEPASVLVSSGGADLGSIAAPLTRALLRCTADVRIDLVIGPGTSAAAPEHPRITVHRSPPTLAHLLAESTLYAGAAGTTAVQAACVGVPAIIAAVADNQVAQARALESAGCALVVEAPIDETSLTEMASRLLGDRARLQAMSRAGRDLVDGFGTQRVATAILELLSMNVS
jgi:UDP-2,4-diacetamido-2,4,6-trideoxy-beta-L-altropyranose hydrolase